jgi:mannose-6-phosphate isomerase-like protein (cupin superfamily)
MLSKTGRNTMAFNKDVIKLAKENTNFREVLFTTERTQLVLMSIEPGGEIGEESHKAADQILVFVEGEGQAILNGVASPLKPGYCVVVPAGTKHNFKNTGQTALKLFTLYAPPQHKPGTIHKTKQDAIGEEPY